MFRQSYSSTSARYARRSLRAARNSSWPPPRGYFAATRHPWPCLMFLIPLLLVYEGGILWLGGAQPDALRNGADTWLHGLLGLLGFQQLYWTPGLMVVALLGWSWWRSYDRPDDTLGVCSGMALESVLAALGLWALSKTWGPILDRLGIIMGNTPRFDGSLAPIITFVGAGIYEELLFRLFLFGGILAGLRALGIAKLIALVPAMVLASVAFAAAHHIGAYGEPFDRFVFVFRVVAGFYFTLIYVFRGFGVAVGAHASYDVIVGMALV